MSALRLITVIVVLVALAACATAERSAPVQQRAVATTQAPQPTPPHGPIQLGRVMVDWRDVSILQQPQFEARRLSSLIYAELEQRALASEVATDKLRVTVLEMFLRAGGRTGVSTDYMTGDIEWLDDTGASKRRFRIKANYTRRGGDPVATEARLDELYAKFADLTIRELTIHQQINDQHSKTSAGQTAAL